MNPHISQLVKSPTRLVIGSLVSLFLLLHLFAVPHVSAHTAGRMQLSAEEAGPYRLTVWTSPEPVTEGELHIALAVVLAEDASPVLDAAVTVILTPEGGEERLSEAASTENSENKFLYEAIFDISETGAYQVDLQVIGADGSRGETSFNLEVESGSSFNWLYIIPVAMVLGATLLLFLALRSRSAE